MRELSLKLRREGEFGPLADALRKDPYGFVTRYRDSVRIGLEKSRARYSPLGQLVASQTIHRRMVMRLRHVEYMKSHPLVSKVRTPSLTLPLLLLSHHDDCTTLSAAPFSL